MSLGGGGARSLKGGAQGGRDPWGFGHRGGEIPGDLAPGARSRGAKSPGHRDLDINCEIMWLYINLGDLQKI